MSKKRYFLFFLFTLAVIINSCKKYPEDEAKIHLRNARHRIIGTWIVTRYEVDGVDSTASFKSNPNYFCQYEFRNRHSQNEFFKLIKTNCGGTIQQTTYWLFQYKENIIDIGAIDFKHLISIYPWLILRLDKSILKLKGESKGLIYILEMKKIN